MTKQESAQRVADKLFATERAVDDAMIQAAQLIEAMVSGRREMELSSTVGEVAQSRAAEAIGALAEARRSVMATHAALAHLRKDLGLTTAIGDDSGKPTQANSDLRAVS
ncbi:MAG: hypothetical protein JSR45_03875 [Proteobacteria bacterium]|nr:hypothetical protein [Pseudomonadota bacterium]